MPTPGPMAARPYPTMLREPSIFLPFLDGSCSMLVSQSAADVDGGEQSEDVGLQELDEAFEEGHDHGEDHGYAAGREADHALRLKEQVFPAQDAQEKNEVAGEHVEGETEGERDRPEDHRRHELDRREQRIDSLGHAGRKHNVLEIAAEALPLDAHVVEDHPRDDREEERDRDPRRGRELQDWNDPRDVDHRDEEEDRGQVRDVFDALSADRVGGDLVAHEAVGALAGELQLAGNETAASRRVLE